MGWDQIGLLWSSPLSVCLVDDQELINDVLDPLGRIDGAELCLNVLEFLGEKLIDHFGGNSALLSLSDEIEKQFAPDVNGHPNFGSKCRRLHRCEPWGCAKDWLGKPAKFLHAGAECHVSGCLRGIVADAVNIAGVSRGHGGLSFDPCFSFEVDAES